MMQKIENIATIVFENIDFFSYSCDNKNSLVRIYSNIG